jgi:hypothetical protein
LLSRKREGSARIALTYYDHEKLASNLPAALPSHSFVRQPMTKAEHEARKAFRQVDAEKAMTEYETAQKAFHANRERLKAERLAREAAGTPVAAKKTKPKKAR